MSISSSDLLATALGYAAAGYSVFPVNGKRPLTESGFKDATTDQDLIRQWWKAWPEAGIALPTGDGLLVLDIDDPAALEMLEAEHGSLPPTVEVVTPRPGRHLYRVQVHWRELRGCRDDAEGVA